MIEHYLLEELVTFAECGTLAAAAKKLGLSQPVITLGMQKLEDQLEVSLFIRTPNKITLTQTGEYAVQAAEKLLKANQQFIRDVQSFQRNQETITVAAIAPGPLFIINQTKQANLFIQQELLPQRISTPNSMSINTATSLLMKCPLIQEFNPPILAKNISPFVSICFLILVVNHP